jgi:hypothetical protein
MDDIDGAENIGMEHLPGMHSATTLLELGLPSAGVIRGLMIEIGLTYDEAALTTSAAEFEHSNANGGRGLRSCSRVHRNEPA